MEDLEIKQNNRFDFHPTPLEGLWIVQRKPVEDQRGFFCRFFCTEEFKAYGFKKPIAQINHNYTVKKGAVRGLHFQYQPHAECKIVSCLRGEVYDVAVDIRKGSPTFLHWHGEIISASNQKCLLIPEGFAHGFQTLVEHCELIYLSTEFYVPEAESGLNVEDKRIAVGWQLPVSCLSERDKNLPFINNSYEGLTL